MERRALPFAIVLALALTRAPSAHAEPTADADGPLTTLDYRAPEGCPDVDALRRAVVKRAHRRGNARHLAGTRLVVRVTDEGSAGMLAMLTIVDRDGSSRERRVPGRTCEETIEATALVLALVLDGDAEDEEPVAATPPTPATPEAAPPPPVPAIPPRAMRPPDATLRPATPRRESLVRTGGGVGLSSEVGPSLAPRAQLFVEMDLGRGSPAAARLGATAALGSSDLPEGRAGEQRYLLVTGEAVVCPWSFRIGPERSLRLLPCVGLALGAHRGATSGVPQATSETSLWIAPSVGGRGRLRIAEGWSIELGVDATAPLRRTRFFLAPSTTLFRPSPLAIRADLALTYDFP
ncbi:MAG: hypothetical protein JST00_20160 [Deltaproteobacteria bacterium]|nr:hypothetical protein [Deltaproteobacteria bacterium]